MSDERGQDLKWTATVMRGLLKLANEFQRTGERDRELTVRRGIEEIHRLRGRGDDKCEHCGGSDFNSPCERCGAPQCCDHCCRITTVAAHVDWLERLIHIDGTNWHERDLARAKLAVTGIGQFIDHCWGKL